MSKQKKEIEARDSEAKQYEQRYLLSKGYLFDWVEKMTVLNALNLQEEDVVLDIGCGTGRLSLEIAQRCRKVYGLDFSTESIAVLNKKINEKGITNIKTFVGDVSELLPIKEKIDKIVSVQVI